jgi:hypothetical protein
MTPRIFICPRELRIYARGRLNAAVKAKQMPRVGTLKCADCGEQATRYDHRDYTKPLDVEPVCHHCDNHRGQGLPNIDGPHVSIDWAIRKVPSKCGECSCPMFSGMAASKRKGEWIEEAQAVTRRSWDILIPTIRKVWK